MRKKWELGAQLKGKLREDTIADASFLRKGPGRGRAALAAGSRAYLKRRPIRTDGYYGASIVAHYPVSARSLLVIDGAMVGEPLAVE